jgi:hypothetical protein
VLNTKLEEAKQTDSSEKKLMQKEEYGALEKVNLVLQKKWMNLNAS